MNTKTSIKPISRLLGNISQLARLQILLAIGEGEACVCHLEALLGCRQAYISQHLMVLRQAGILETRRDGRYIFYSLKDARLLELIGKAGSIAGISQAELEKLINADPLPQCCCPDCVSQIHTQVILEE